MLLEDLLGHLLALAGQTDAQGTAIVGVGLALDQGFALQPIAHSAHLWNLLGMVLVGWGSVLLGGCPLRQLILAGSGNGDSTVTVFGMLAGRNVMAKKV